jgi:hypothetical protein
VRFDGEGRKKRDEAWNCNSHGDGKNRGRGDGGGPEWGVRSKRKKVTGEEVGSAGTEELRTSGRPSGGGGGGARRRSR